MNEVLRNLSLEVDMTGNGAKELEQWNNKLKESTGLGNKASASVAEMQKSFTSTKEKVGQTNTEMMQFSAAMQIVAASSVFMFVKGFFTDLIKSADGMDKVMEQLSSVFSDVKDQVSTLLKQALMPLIENAILPLLRDILVPLIEKAKEMFDWVMKNEQAAFAFRLALLFLTMFFSIYFVSSVWSAIKALNIFNLALAKALLPIVAVVAAITAVYLILEDLYYWATGKGNNLLGPWLEKTLGAEKAGMIKKGIQELIAWLSKAFETLVDKGGEALYFLMETITPIVEVVRKHLGPLRQAMGPILSVLWEINKIVFKIIFEVIGGAVKVLAPVIAFLISGIASVVAFIIDAAFTVIEAIGSIIEFVKSVPDRIVEFISSIPDRIASALSAVKTMLVKLFKDIFPPAVYKMIAKVSGIDMEARAGGGPVDRDRPYLVGERGPEVIMPRQPGFVVPNFALPGGGNVYNVTVSPVLNFTGVSREDAADIEEAVMSAMSEAMDQLKQALGVG